MYGKPLAFGNACETHLLIAARLSLAAMRRTFEDLRPVRQSLTAHQAAEPHGVLECALRFHQQFRGKEKWQTYLFVRNQMVRT